MSKIRFRSMKKEKESLIVLTLYSFWIVMSGLRRPAPLTLRRGPYNYFCSECCTGGESNSTTREALPCIHPLPSARLERSQGPFFKPSGRTRAEFESSHSLSIPSKYYFSKADRMSYETLSNLWQILFWLLVIAKYICQKQSVSVKLCSTVFEFMSASASEGCQYEQWPLWTYCLIWGAWCPASFLIFTENQVRNRWKKRSRFWRMWWLPLKEKRVEQNIIAFIVRKSALHETHSFFRSSFLRYILANFWWRTTAIL